MMVVKGCWEKKIMNSLMSVEFHLRKMEMFWRWFVQQCEYTKHYRTVFSKIVKVKIFNFFFTIIKKKRWYRASALLAGKFSLETWATMEVVKIPWGRHSVRKPKLVYKEVPHEQTWYHLNQDRWPAQLLHLPISLQSHKKGWIRSA